MVTPLLFSFSAATLGPGGEGTRLLWPPCSCPLLGEDWLPLGSMAVTLPMLPPCTYIYTFLGRSACSMYCTLAEIETQYCTLAGIGSAACIGCDGKMFRVSACSECNNQELVRDCEEWIYRKLCIRVWGSRN
jgi:hypothetical protein